MCTDRQDDLPLPIRDVPFEVDLLTSQQALKWQPTRVLFGGKCCSEGTPEDECALSAPIFSHHSAPLDTLTSSSSHHITHCCQLHLLPSLFWSQSSPSWVTPSCTFLTRTAPLHPTATHCSPHSGPLTALHPMTSSQRSLPLSLTMQQLAMNFWYRSIISPTAAQMLFVSAAFLYHDTFRSLDKELLMRLPYS